MIDKASIDGFVKSVQFWFSVIPVKLVPAKAGNENPVGAVREPPLHPPRGNDDFLRDHFNGGKFISPPDLELVLVQPAGFGPSLPRCALFSRHPDLQHTGEFIILRKADDFFHFHFPHIPV